MGGEELSQEPIQQPLHVAVLCACFGADPAVERKLPLASVSVHWKGVKVRTMELTFGSMWNGMFYLDDTKNGPMADE